MRRPRRVLRGHGPGAKLGDDKSQLIAGRPAGGRGECEANLEPSRVRPRTEVEPDHCLVR